MDRLKIGKLLKRFTTTVDIESTETTVSKKSSLVRPPSAFKNKRISDRQTLELSNRSICLLKIHEAIWDWGEMYTDKHHSIVDDVQAILDELGQTINLKLARFLSADDIEISHELLANITSSRTKKNHWLSLLKTCSTFRRSIPLSPVVEGVLRPGSQRALPVINPKKKYCKTAGARTK